jgi:exosortase A-associated hydrolase 1
VSGLEESPSILAIDGNEAVAITHRPARPAAVGLLILVGGPQYRIGAHRQYVHLARGAAEAGFAAMRFDYRGVGDSEGTYPGFEHVGPDIDAAIGHFLAAAPGVERVALWGLCEAASASLIHSAQDPRVAGMALVNPWVRTEAGRARTYLRHYYLGRLFERGFWDKALKGKLDLRASARDLAGMVKTAAERKPMKAAAAGRLYTERMLEGLETFPNPVLVILSGDDLTAREFETFAAGSRRWRRALADPRVERADIAGADHTFSSKAWKTAVAERTIAWMRRLADGT